MDHDQIRDLLHAYADDELDPADVREIEQHLRGCDDCRRAEEQIRSLREALTNSVPAYKAPAHLRRSVRRALRNEAKPAPRVLLPWLVFAAGTACALFFLTLALFQAARGPQQSLADEVIANHVRSLLATHLLDVPSSDQHTVKPWFDGKIDFAPEVRDLSANGFPLDGGRLDYLNGRNVVALVYHRNKHPINLFIMPASGSRDTEPRPITKRGYNVLHWTRAGMDYWAVSDLNQEELRQFAQLLAQ